MRLFLSHTKRDTIGLETAEALKKYLDHLAVNRFFDDVSIQPGDDVTQELIDGISDSALVAIRTDGYVASPWCRKELSLAKQAGRPMVIVDALTGTRHGCRRFRESAEHQDQSARPDQRCIRSGHKLHWPRGP